MLFYYSGYLVIGSSMMVAIFPASIMPRMLPGTRERLIKRLTSAAQEGKEKYEEVVNSLRPKGKIGIAGSFHIDFVDHFMSHITFCSDM